MLLLSYFLGDLMNITKKVCIYILVGLITVTGTFTSFYKGAYAFEYVGGALAFEEAIKWLLASVGIISAGGMTADYWENHSQEFEDYCAQQNITDTEVAEWQMKLCEGVLDKGSECWQAFKEWASTLTGSSSGGGSGADLTTVSGITSFLSDYFNIDLSINSNKLGNSTIYAFIVYTNDSPNYGIRFFTSNGSYSLNGNLSAYYVYKDGASFYGTKGYSYPNFNINNASSVINIDTSDGIISLAGSTDIYLYNVVNNVDGLNANYFDGSSDSDFISVQSDVTDLDVISSPIPDTDAQEVAIPMPGVSDSDNEASADAYDNIVDQVNDGTLDLDDAITQIQDTLKIIVYEEETEKIFPKPDNEEDQEDLDDKINQNKDNMGFTLGGLENVFPFCIPWDIYAFMSLLRAEPVPPKIELPFPNPLKPNEPWLVEVDFADWDDGMRIVRLAEDFLFIIGLAVLTRSLIGAGGGDG